MGRSQRIGILAEYGFWLALAIFFFAYSFEFAQPDGTHIISAQVWPRIFAVVVAVVATAYAAEKLMGEADETEKPRVTVRGVVGFMKLVVAPLAYAYLLPRVGFFVATPLFLLAQLVALGERRVGVLLAVTSFVFVAVALVFTSVFFVALPVGNWPGFYAINNAIVSALR